MDPEKAARREQRRRHSQELRKLAEQVVAWFQGKTTELDPSIELVEGPRLKSVYTYDAQGRVISVTDVPITPDDEHQ